MKHIELLIGDYEYDAIKEIFKKEDDFKPITEIEFDNYTDKFASELTLSNMDENKIGKNKIGYKCLNIHSNIF